MAVKVKVDEDLPRAAVDLLRDWGYDAAGVYEQGMSGWKDPELWRAVQAEGRFLVTADKGFGDIRTYPPRNSPGYPRVAAFRTRGPSHTRSAG